MPPRHKKENKMENAYNALITAMKGNADAVENALAECIRDTDKDYGLIFDAERYSLLGGGKRVRPFIVNECCRMLGGDISKSMPLACAVEMVHAYSLIHDDLPCMDDDDLRRGKPSNHKAFGYANALLAGDALLTRAFSVIAEAKELDGETKAEAVRLLALAAGDRGMIGGQIMDLIGETEELEFDTLLKLHAHKTAALIECSALLGALAAGYREDSVEAKALSEYAVRVGIAFQVIDDVLDVTADETQLGKNTGSDAGHNKTTFLTYYDVDGARSYAAELTAAAVSSVSHIESSELLTDFACYLLERKK